VHALAIPARRPLLTAIALVVVALAAMLVLVYGPGPNGAKASSHSEAPLISQDPRADNTDLYAFVSPDDTNKVSIIANYIPLEAPASGPNFYSFDDSALYEINVDNTGDGKADIGYQFRFHTTTVNPDTFLYAGAPIGFANGAYTNWNRPQTYTVTLVHFNKDGKVIGNPDHPGKGPNDPVILGKNITTPPDNVGPRTTPNYDALAAHAVTDLGNGDTVFAGQRDDPFYVDLGSIFDLGGLRPFNPFHLIPLGAEAGRDALKDYNTHSIVLQVPISQLTTFDHPNIGIYASASRHKETILEENGTKDGHGPWVQVSRLGNPLVNEVVIPLGDKDYWNREDPSDEAQFEHYYLNPEVSLLENILYGTPPQGHPGGALQNIDEHNRTDLVGVELTGLKFGSFNLNFTGSTPADLLRLNTSIKPGVQGACPGGTASPAAPDRLAVLANPVPDLCGYPNGRRLGDDVIDIDLRAFAQGYGAFLNSAFGLPDKSPNDLLGDGVDANDAPFSSTFPYVASPHQGYQVPGP
jgi:hypothetical protein